MRILYLHQYFNTPEMAGSTRSFEIGRRLVAAGHRVDLITSWQQPSDRRDWSVTNVSGMHVHWLPVPYSNHMTYRERIGAFFQFAFGAARYAANVRADVVFATSTPLTIALPAVYAARRQRIPMVFEVRDLWPDLPIALGAIRNPVLQWSARRLERFAYANSARVVALSPGMAAGVVRAGYPQNRIAVVPNGADLDFFRRNAEAGRDFRRKSGVADGKIVVGYAGTLGRINGVDYLVKLAAALKSDDRFLFLTVGDGREKDEVRDLALKQGVLDHNFLMLPKVPKVEMPAVLSAVDIATSLVVPVKELEDNSANKFFDALASGCCVAVNHGGWQADLLRETGAGIQLAFDPNVAAQQLQALADKPALIEHAGQHARALAERRFSRDKLAEDVEEIFMQVVTRTART